jgi:hypothetical protein
LIFGACGYTLSGGVVGEGVGRAGVNAEVGGVVAPETLGTVLDAAAGTRVAVLVVVGGVGAAGRAETVGGVSIVGGGRAVVDADVAVGIEVRV